MYVRHCTCIVNVMTFWIILRRQDFAKLCYAAKRGVSTAYLFPSRHVSLLSEYDALQYIWRAPLWVWWSSQHRSTCTDQPIAVRLTSHTHSMLHELLRQKDVLLLDPANTFISIVWAMYSKSLQEAISLPVASATLWHIQKMHWMRAGNILAEWFGWELVTCCHSVECSCENSRNVQQKELQK